MKLKKRENGMFANERKKKFVRFSEEESFLCKSTNVSDDNCLI